MQYTRSQLAAHYGITRSKLRRILKALEIQPVQEKRTAKGLPVYYYDQGTVQTINKYLQLLRQKRMAQIKKCCICKRYFPVQQMIVNRCAQCYVERCCKPIVYGKQVWNKVVNTKLVSAAIQYLSNVQ